MAKAFLSHSSKDKTLIEKIARQLGRNNCHYDTLTFEAGQQTIDEIFSGLEDTDVFVLFISEASLQSPWVKKEITQAKKFSDQKIIDRIFPLIIDKTISHNDHRIPNWIKKPFNIRYFDNEVLILKKIQQFLREINFRKYSHLREQNELFVGRNELIQEFERKIINLDNTKPVCIVASSYFDGIGRRTFVKNGLVKTHIIDKLYDPVLISINSKESIEDFIYKLNFVESSPEIFTHDFTTDDIRAKVNLAVDQVKKFSDSGEILFVIDEGSIVLPNHSVVDWFKDIIRDSKLQNQISICLISKFKPFGASIRKLNSLLGFQIDELSVPDTQTLFLQYLNLLRHNISSEDAKFFLQYLKGIPAQIIYAANLIESMGVSEARRYVNDIEEFDELRVLSVFDFLKDDPLSKQILIALSRFEIISHNLVYKIFGESEDVFRSIQKLFDLSLLFSVSSSHDYLKLNTSISDYINRSKIQLEKQHVETIKNIAKETLSKPLELNEQSDYSEFLFTLQTMIQENVQIPKKYLIPSFILKSIVKEYNARSFNTAIELSVKLLENESRFDPQIIRETRYWLCLSYCRTQNEKKFFETVKYFSNVEENLKDYHFLLGFYYRNGDEIDEAERNFLEVLKIDGRHSRTKRELVNVYLRKGDYMKALNLAQENYYRFRTNILHIQAYFTCLIKKENFSEQDLEIIRELIEAASKSLDKKSDEIKNLMEAEFNFYVAGDKNKAISSLKESLKLNPGNYFAFRALIEIYKRLNYYREIEHLIEQHSNITQPDPD